MKRLGILGGLGPESTAYFFNLVIENTPVKIDQDHIPIIIYNNPQIPDRNQHILHNKKSPLPELIKGIKFLNEAKVDYIVIPCNTVYYYYSELISQSRVPIINMIDITANYISSNFHDINRVALFATTSLIKTNVYQKIMQKYGIDLELLSPSVRENLIMKAIYDVKAKQYFKAKNLLFEAIELLKQNDIEILITGCTELPIVLKQDEVSIKLLDPMFIMAKEAIKLCLNNDD